MDRTTASRANLKKASAANHARGVKNSGVDFHCACGKFSASDRQHVVRHIERSGSAACTPIAEARRQLNYYEKDSQECKDKQAHKQHLQSVANGTGVFLTCSCCGEQVYFSLSAWNSSDQDWQRTWHNHLETDGCKRGRDNDVISADEEATLLDDMLASRDLPSLRKEKGTGASAWALPAVPDAFIACNNVKEAELMALNTEDATGFELAPGMEHLVPLEFYCRDREYASWDKDNTVLDGKQLTAAEKHRGLEEDARLSRQRREGAQERACDEDPPQGAGRRLRPRDRHGPARHGPAVPRRQQRALLLRMRCEVPRRGRAPQREGEDGRCVVFVE